MSGSAWFGRDKDALTRRVTSAWWPRRPRRIRQRAGQEVCGRAEAEGHFPCPQRSGQTL